MNRTPIKIPGKNTRDGSKAAIAARKALKRPPGRPLKLIPTTAPSASPKISSEAASNAKKRSLKHIKSRRKMSLLEKLPTELLVEIFLFCMNLGLPRSSPIIGAKLTSELVYTRTVIKAFGPTWEKDYGNFVLGARCNYEPPGIDDDYLKDLPPPLPKKHRGYGDGKLQSALLRCRWISLPILQKSQEIWISRFGKERTFTPLPFRVIFDKDVERRLQKDRHDRKLTPAKFFDEDFNTFSSEFMTLNRVQARIHIFNNPNKDWSCYVDVAGDCEIPQSLLLGPWTEESTQFLFWLVKGGARLDWLSSTTGEAAKLGCERAVVEGDLRVIHLLFWAGLWDQLSVGELLWVISNAGGDRYNVVAEVISLWNGSINDSYEVEEGLAKLVERAEEESDTELIGYIKRLLNELRETRIA